MRPANAGLVRDLGRLLAPERVLSKPIERLARSRDASIYRLVPEAVVRPQDVAEMRTLFAYARRHRRHLTFRAGGTSLSGQAVGDDLLVELGPHWRAFRVLDGGARVWAQPGVIGGHLNRWLGPRHRIGPDPASIDAAMIGGILANNSSGMCCGVAQNAYHTLEAATILLTDGTLVDTGAPDADARLRAEAPDLHAGLLRLRDEIRGNSALADRVRRRFARKNTTGYSLNAFLDHDAPAQILARLMVGSEGTLAFLADATLRTVPEPPERATGLFLFRELPEAGAAVEPLATAGADAVEILDEACLRVLARAGHGPFPGEAIAALLVEFRRDEAGVLEDATRGASEVLAAAAVAGSTFSRDPERRSALWKMRKGLAPATGALRSSGTAYMTEDIGFPVERLAAAIADCQALFARHSMPETVVFGHAKDGNLHFVLSQDLTRKEAVARYDAFLRELVDLVVVRYDGALKAEHGAGRNMAPFVETEWGAEAYRMMRRVKALLDPDGILSPDVVLTDDPQAHLKNLKPVPTIAPEADACTECGLCEPRCPSRHLTLTPRQRIVVTREIEQLTQEGSPAALELRDGLCAELVHHGVETCAGDSMCAVACPIGIDSGRLMKDARASGRSELAISLARLAADQFSTAAAVARLGLAAGSYARLPQLRDTAAAPRLPRAVPAAADVVYFPSCVTRTLDSHPGAPPLAEALLAVLGAVGFAPRYPESVETLCCGLVFESRGFPEAARRARERSIAALLRASRDARGLVVTDASPCARTLGAAAAEQGLQVLDFPTFWARHGLARLPGPRRVPGVAVLHPTCSLVASGGLPDLIAVATAHAESVFVPPAAECCGFAGDRGFFVPELTASATVAEAEQVRSVSNASGHYSTCRTCEIGMTRATQRPYRSMVHLVHGALGLV